MEKFAHRGGRRGLETFLKPDKIHIKSRFGAFTSVWAGSYNTVAVTKTGEVMVCGLNNYNQMGIADGLTFYMPVVSRDLSKHRWDGVAIGQHHALGQVLNRWMDQWMNG
jgi:alpha-tubulin suppressor-like RCC1 family protein